MYTIHCIIGYLGTKVDSDKPQYTEEPIPTTFLTSKKGTYNFSTSYKSTHHFSNNFQPYLQLL